jgi:murein DD-endopeptidase MepM/ murein hydrolase activator NlpD
VVSGTIFVLLVGIKLLLPERLAQVGEPISNALERNMDVSEVFSAVSRGFSGGNPGASWDGLYKAVFAPEGTVEVKPVSLVPGDLLADMRAFADGTAGAYEWLVHDKNSQDDVLPMDSGSAVGLYTGGDYPDNTEPEQVVLGFDYIAPVSGSVSSGFGYREDPLAGGDRFHYGLDLTADTGDPIVAFADGMVTVTGESSGYGKYLILSHGGECTTLYAHCSEIFAGSGERVLKGERIAAVGDTGQRTGPHLHFELQRSGVYLNPIYYVA